MSSLKYSLVLLTVALLAYSAYSFDEHAEHKCTHDLQDRPEPEFADVDEGFSEGNMQEHEGRTLADYPNLRTYGYYGLLDSAPGNYKSYFQNDVIPPILDYFSAALKVKFPVSGKLKMTGSRTCGVNTPSVLKNGVEADYFFFMETDFDTGSSWVASSYACNLATGSKRPLTAKLTINRDRMKVATNDVLLHEKNMICVMHEVTHTLGFSSSYYKYFLNANGNKRSGHITSASLDGSTSTVLNVEPLTTRIRNHFGCSTLKGAYMENSGSAATAGSHFERRMFSFEFMTSGLIYEMQISQFTLALFEGSGWYVPDYSYADEFHWGQGQGCNFLTKKCSSSGFNYDEFCTGSSRGCTNPGRAGGSCSSDVRSDGCKFIHPNVNYDCENSNGDNYARLPAVETYGRGAGSKCFTGTLSSSSSSASKTSFCFKYSCTGSGSNTQLTVKLGSKSAVCAKEGPLSVSGFKGHITCPDPYTFCNTVGRKICPRGCMGRGSCVEGVCKCKSGYKGTDCSIRA